ncbi:MAG: porin [Saprospiraceae bacterium]|nr:porin [Saprospiraceae bacterium]
MGAYVDAYYGFTTSKIMDNNIPYFVNMHRNKEFNINLAYIDLKFTAKNFRARFVPGFGSYINANYASEPGSLKNIVEASAGFRLFKNKDVWVDAGVLGSPYTNENCISKDHLMYTRSFAPEYVPYYISGLKLTVPLSNKVSAYLYLINGWQQIQDNNDNKAIGTQIEYRPNSKNLFNWNTFIGDERSLTSPLNRMRYFTDIYWIYNPEGKFSITSCIYMGNQKLLETDGKKSNNYWWQANVIGRYTFNNKWSLSGRIEYFNDDKNVQLNAINPMIGFRTFSSGLCLNIKVNDQAMVRFEGRRFFSPDNVYNDSKGLPDKNMTWFISNTTIWF